MRKKDMDHPAAPGSLPASAVNDLITLRAFERHRDKLLEQLFGSKMRRSRLREEIIRLAVLEHGLGRSRTTAYYKRECAALGSTTAIRQEIARCVSFQLLILEEDPDDLRAQRVIVTQRLVNWYVSLLPRVNTEFGGIFVIRA